MKISKKVFVVSLMTLLLVSSFKISVSAAREHWIDPSTSVEGIWTP